MKKIFFVITVWCTYIPANAQTITAAEFFVDTDPGVGNATAITPAPSGTTVNFSAIIPTTLLSNGFHFVGIRTRDELGKWGLYENRGFYISNSTTSAGNIVAAEFFIDSDPGVGNATAITPAPSGANPIFAVSVPATSLSNGFHFIAIRTKDADGKWGLYENRGFYISSATTNVSNITAAEFFIDADPGVGNAIAITPAPTGANPTFIVNVSTTTLAAGFHFVAIRTRDAEGKWGLFENRGFYISTATTNIGNIVAAEFFIDSDPGVGNGTAITPAPTGANPAFVALVPTTSLSPGFHFVAIRTKVVDGHWGLFENRGFYISTQTTNSAGMTDAEYFIDTDPGIGNGTPFAIPGGQSFNQNFVLPIPPGTSNGEHFVAIRVKNTWGLFAFDTITVAGTLPLNLLSFTAYKQQSSVWLKWKTDNEINTSHFDIERSSNGTVFTKIATTASANSQGVHEYTMEDSQPYSGINFYRLKQIDIDGHFKYSQIVRVLFDSYGKPLTIYPNPATQFVQFDFGGRQKNVLVNVYDAVGSQVLVLSLANQSPLKLNIQQFPKGKYIVQLSDGETVQSGNFIKQ